MERRKFFKSLGLLSLAAITPKFLFGTSKNTQIESGSFSKECTSNIDVKSKEAIPIKENEIHSIIHKDLNGDVNLYIADNIGLPKHYIQKNGEGDFIFFSEIPSQKPNKLNVQFIEFNIPATRFYYYVGKK